jgi:hypothetical protein
MVRPLKVVIYPETRDGVIRITKSMNVLQRDFRYGWIVFGLVGTGACNGGVPSPTEDSLNLVSKFANQVPRTKPIQPKAEASPRVVLVIDGSQSMRGFADCNRSGYEYSTIVDRLTTDLGVTGVLRFGQDAMNRSRVLDTLQLSRVIHCAEFYDRRQNPDYELYKIVADDSTNATYVYITDGVQSDISGTNLSPSVVALKNWLESGHGLAIIGFRSRFSGRAWSEQLQRMFDNISVESRPFFAFVLAPDESELDRAIGQLSSQALLAAEVIRFRNTALECSVELHQGIPYWNHQSFWWAVKLDAIRSDTLADYRCQIDPEYPFKSVTPVIAAEYTERTDGAFPPLGPTPGGTAFSIGRIKTKGDSSSAEILVPIPKSTSNRFGYFQLRVSPKPGAFRQEIEQLSIDTDADPANFSKTYRFSWLVDQLARTHLTKTPWVPFALTVQYN